MVTKEDIIKALKDSNYLMNQAKLQIRTLSSKNEELNKMRKEIDDELQELEKKKEEIKASMEGIIKTKQQLLNERRALDEEIKKFEE